MRLVRILLLTTLSLIVDGAGPPHGFNLTPSQARAHAAIVTLINADGWETLAPRAGGPFDEPDEDADDYTAAMPDDPHDDARAHGEVDAHVRLDPANANNMVNEIAAALVAADARAICASSQPLFSTKLVSVVVDGTDARAAVLDPLGASIDRGPDLYFTLMPDMATSIRTVSSPKADGSAVSIG